MVTAALIIGGATIAGAGLSYLSAKEQANAARSAAETQSAAADRAADFQYAQYLQSREDLAPWREVGGRALTGLESMTWQPLERPGPYQHLAAYQGPPPVDPAGYQFTPPTAEDLTRDPGYQFRLAEGRRLLEGGAAAKGLLQSGGTLRGTVELGQNLASQEYGNVYSRMLQHNQERYARDVAANQASYTKGAAQNVDEYQRGLGEYQLNTQLPLALRQQQYNELAGLANTGQTSATNTAQLGQQGATNVANLYQAAGTAQAGGQLGAANAQAAGLQGIGNAAQSGLDTYLLEQQRQRYNQLASQRVSFYGTGARPQPQGSTGLAPSGIRGQRPTPSIAGASRENLLMPLDPLLVNRGPHVFQAKPLDYGGLLLTGQKLALGSEQLAAKERALQEEEAIRQLYRRQGTPGQAPAAPPEPGGASASAPQPDGSWSSMVPPRVGEGGGGLMQAAPGAPAARTDPGPTMQEIGAISPTRALQFGKAQAEMRSQTAQADVHDIAARRAKLATFSDILAAVLEADTQEAYDVARMQVRQTLGAEAADSMPAVYDRQRVMQGYGAGITAEQRLKDLQETRLGAKERRESGLALSQVPEYVKGEGPLNAAIDVRMKRAGLLGRPPAEVLEGARQDVQQGKVDVSSAQGREQAQQRALSQTGQARLEAYDKVGLAAESTHTVLDQLEALIQSPAGVYGNSLQARLAMTRYNAGMSPSDQRARNTAQLRQLASQLQLAHGSLGTGVSEYDARVYAKAAGDLQDAQNVEQMRQYIGQMRPVLDKAQARANEARKTWEETARLPEFGSGRRGQAGPLDAAAPTPAVTGAAGPGKTVRRAVLEQAARKQNMSVEDAIKLFHEDGYTVK